MATLDEAARTLDIRLMLISSIVTALAFVVGLFWNEAIKETIAQLVPAGEGLYYKYVSAIVMTVVVVVISYLLYRSQKLRVSYITQLSRRSTRHVLKTVDALKLKKKDADRIKREILKGS